MSEKGNLIVSTKQDQSGINRGFLVYAVFLVFISIFMFSETGRNICMEIGFDFFGGRSGIKMGELLAVVIGGMCLGCAVMIFVAIFKGKPSYCDVYENVVTGRPLSIAAQEFTVCYNEIESAKEENGNIVLITKYGKYIVGAPVNRTQALKEIHSRAFK